MSNNETGHYKNIAALEELIIYVTKLGAKYNPSNPQLTIDSLQSLYDRAKSGYRQVTQLTTDFNNAVGERALQFDQVKSFATQVVSAFKTSSKANGEQLADLQTFNRKIQGLRASAKKPTEPVDPNTPVPTTISASQQSFDMRYDYVQKMVEAVVAEPTYNPNESDLTKDALRDFADRLAAANTKVAKTFEDVRSARITRDTALYGPDDGIYAVQASVKDYIKSAFKAKSTAYKQALAIRFSRPAKKRLKLN